MIACLLSPVDCVSGLATGAANAILSLFPFGILGLAFTVGLIIGAIVGKWGIAALIALAVAVKFGTKASTATDDDIWPHPDGSNMQKMHRAPKRKPARTAKRATGKRTYDPDTNEWK